MKVPVFVCCVAIFCSSVFAESDTYDYVFSGQSQNPTLTWHAGLTFEHHANISNTKPGIEAGVTFNKKFMCGVYGQGTTGNFGVAYDSGVVHNIMFGEGGFFAGYISGYNCPLHFGGLFKIGYISLVADDKEMKLFKDVDPVAEDNGMVFHPEVFAETNILKKLKVRLGIGYSFNSLDKESVICNRNLDSWTMNLSILTGNFAK